MFPSDRVWRARLGCIRHQAAMAKSLNRPRDETLRRIAEQIEEDFPGIFDSRTGARRDITDVVNTVYGNGAGMGVAATDGQDPPAATPL